MKENLKGNHLSWIVVKDLDAAVKFYTEVLGLQLKSQTPEYGWAELSGPEGSILGIGQENPHMDMHAGVNAVMTFSVNNIEEARESFLNKGATLVGDVVEIPGHVKMQTFTDADGNMMQLCETL